MTMAKPAVLSISEAAAARVRQLVERSDEPVLGLRVGVRKGGCSGLMYEVEYAREKQGFEEVVEDKGVKVFVDPMALMYLIGAEMDWRESRFESGFVFNNPNEIDRCGCGESFRIGDEA
jgi:iron-sulfur cluster assembly protein